MFQVGEVIKLNEELCPEDKREIPRHAFGSLNYMALFLVWELEVIRVFEDSSVGTMIEVKVLNDDKVRSNMVFKAEDCVLASKQMKKIDFELLGTVNKNQSKIDEINRDLKSLVDTRSQKKSQGVKVSDKNMVRNWSEIKSLRSSLKKLEESKAELVFSVKHKTGTFELDCKEEDIPKTLRKAIRDNRRMAKAITPTRKKITSNLFFDKIGGVLTKSGVFLELNEKYAITMIKEHKKPTTADHYVGIEIEMLSPKSIDAMNKEFIAARVHKYVNIGTDASIRIDDDSVNSMELRICLPEFLLESHLKIICEVLRKNGCYSNRSCGMHVHIDMRNRNPVLCYSNFFKVQDIMLLTQPEARRRNKYCLPNSEPTRTMEDFKSGSEYGRRSAININSYTKNDMKTIEIRVHEGATKFKDVYNWVQFLVGTASLKSELSGVVKTTSELKELGYLSDKVISHLEERYEEYSA